MGDFNEITWSEEKKGGNYGSWQNMRRFIEATSYCELLDLGWTGSKFTWSNGRRGGDLIRERLDRGMVNPAWKNM